MTPEGQALHALFFVPCEICQVPTSVFELDDHGICDDCLVGSMTEEEIEASLRASGIDLDAVYARIDETIKEVERG